MKTLKSLTAALLALVVLKSSAYGQQWDGAQNTTGNIFRSGSVGIGTSTAGAKLDVYGDGTNWSQGFLFLRNKNNKDAGIRLYNDTDVKHHIYNAVSLDNLLRIMPEGNANGGISIKQNGNVGIGTTNPNATLTINSMAGDGAGTVANGISFLDNVNRRGPWGHAGIWSDGYAGFNGDLVFGTDGDNQNNINITEKMRIKGNGNVGIGTSTAQAKLDVYGDGTHWSQGFLFLRNKNNKDAGIRFYNNTDVKYHIYNAVSLDNLLRIMPEGNANGGISIIQNGNVGIGTTSPTEKLTVHGNILAENYNYKTVKYGRKGVVGAVFIPTEVENTAWVPSEDGYGYLIADPWVPSGGLKLCNDNCYSRVTPVSGDVVLRANVVLPEGTEVTKFECFWLDKAAPTADFEFKLMRKRCDDVTATEMATVEGSTNVFAAANTVHSKWDISINEPIIDTANSFLYYIVGRWSVNEMGDALRFYGCLVSYTITQAGPP